MTSPCRALTQTGVRDVTRLNRICQRLSSDQSAWTRWIASGWLHCERVVGSVARGYRHGFHILDLDAAGLPSGTVYPILPHSRPRGSAAARWENAATQREQRRRATTSSPRPASPSPSRRARAIPHSGNCRRAQGSDGPDENHGAPIGWRRVLQRLPILPRSRHLPLASTDGSPTRNVNKTGVRLWSVPRRSY